MRGAHAVSSWRPISSVGFHSRDIASFPSALRFAQSIHFTPPLHTVSFYSLSIPLHTQLGTLKFEGNQQIEDVDEYEDDEEIYEGEENAGEKLADTVSDRREEQNGLLPAEYVKPRNFPPLTTKEKKELRSFANGLGKKIVSHHIGKSGVTASLARAVSDALESNEILKLKILETCSDEVPDVANKIEAATLAQVVSQVGRVLILYRPSLRKPAAAAEQKSKSSKSPRKGARKPAQNLRR